MRVLFDHSTPAPLRFRLKSHVVNEARDLGWERLSNGDLLNVAESDGFEVFVTADKNIRYQQNLTGRKIAIVVIGHARWKVLRRYTDPVVAAVNAATPGSFDEVSVPFS